MKRTMASAADPDGQPLMDTLLDLEVAPSEAYNTVQGTHNMAGKNVIAAMDARFVETNAKFAETNAKFAETNAKFVETNARITETNARITETHAMIASIGAELRTLKWICGLSLALSGMLLTVMVALILYLLPGDPAPSKATVATAVAEDSNPPARPAGTDAEDTREEAAEQDAPQ